MNKQTRSGYAMVNPAGIIYFHTISRKKGDAVKLMQVSEDEEWQYWKDGWDCIAVTITVEPRSKHAQKIIK